MSIKAVIFDLDGVIVSTDEYHYRAWKAMADGEGIYFDRTINERLRGVSRMESLEIILEKSQKKYTSEEKIHLAEKKNSIYRELLNELKPTDILKGVNEVLEILKEEGIKIAIGSSSKNTPTILEKIGMEKYFDAVADGNEIKNSKPDPEVFLLAAKKLGINKEECLVVEDADAGVEAALNGGMKVLAVGYASNNKKASYRFKDLSYVDIKEII
ncbi:beta-phosphoglucomutase [Clostridium felsineum]|uniref:beta-phosphoglucomutase n=1 Tax=Clostridium felsineum TaxID=36839 RepID=UPI00098C88CE|nr:beta-phosphoglucomutase [Clostridium felsineum]MCR3759516.1 beta-phosphoglucomutase [Clostridium felsineum]URZ04200.1 Beta-phosphoglucomutase [Clostridium felsineum]